MIIWSRKVLLTHIPLSIQKSVPFLPFSFSPPITKLLVILSLDYYQSLQVAEHNHSDATTHHVQNTIQSISGITHFSSLLPPERPYVTITLTLAFRNSNLIIILGLVQAKFTIVLFLKLIIRIATPLAFSFLSTPTYTHFTHLHHFFHLYFC